MMASLPAVNDSQSSEVRKNTTTPLRPPEQGLKCPRCDSPNTKFCYYNNYSLTQPRHFCKTCRRYWTKGGALRNVPVGGGCRKNKKSKSSASSSSSSSSSRVPLDPFDPITGLPDPSSGVGMKFFSGLSPAPAMDFQLGFPFSRLHSSATSGVFSSNQFISFGDFTPAMASSGAGASATSMVGFNYPLSSAVGVYSEMGGSSSAVNNNTHSSLASSIESLSCINQDLHWKLQQQRLAMFLGGGTHKESSVTALPEPLLDDQQENLSFQVTDSSRAEVCGSSGPRKGCVSGTEATPAWFLESSYTIPNTNTTANNNRTNSSSDNNTSNWNTIPTWNEMHQFTTLL